MFSDCNIKLTLFYCRYSVPREDPSGQSCILGYGDYLRVRDAARVLSEEERMIRMEEIKRMKEENMVRHT